ncbi:sugar-binding transcriptional regulator [Nocardioides oleivorans]|uniref:Sugar-binding transcriptional regulator n=1 Tax=Nocardioides oleivorans TaxID=273676 RepID=A0A4Q2RWF8_9ACTN|nr:sugar-binding domain-containing protein [Nocardioides oleivorans]RYB93437.1 sugar-binding transcriptional regulator [Nocardioides oleivorans]
MPAARDPAILMRVAELYYLEDKSQAEIAELLSTGRPNVSRMLKEAQRQGIVEIKVHDPSGRVRDLERRLAQAFGLSEVRVSARNPHAGETASRVGALVSGLLLDQLGESTTVGISWGRALHASVEAMSTDRDHDVTVVQLLGGMSAIGNEVSGQELARSLAVALGGTYRLMHAPATLGSPEAAQALREEPSVAQALEAARSCDIALVGIGTPASGSSAAVVESLALDAADARAFWDQEPVGDLAGRYFTATGAPVDGPVDDRVISVSLHDLAAIPLVIGVALGRDKTAAVHGALLGHHVDALVCDESLARSLLTHQSPSQEGTT